MRQLLVIDHYALPDLGTEATEREWDILLLGRNGHRFVQQNGAALDRLGAWRMVSMVELTDAAHSAVREFALEMVRSLPDSDLSGGSIARQLVHGSVNHWWYLVTSETSPFRSPFITRLLGLAFVAGAEERGDYAERCLCLNDLALARVVEADGRIPTRMIDPSQGGTTPASARFPSLYMLAHALRTAAGALLCRLAAPKASFAETGGTAFFTTYPRWWLSSPGAAPSERFFSQLPPHAWYAAWLDPPTKTWRKRRSLGTLLASRRIVPLQAYLRWSDLVEVLSPRWLLRLWHFRRRMRTGLHISFLGWDIGPLVSDDLTRSLGTSEFFVDLLIERTMGRLVQDRQPAGLVYRCEFQPSENALLNGAGTTAPTVGFFHSPFGRNYLPMRFAPGEVENYLQVRNPARDRPLPSGLLACGSLGVDLLEADGFPPGSIATCGPQRFADLLAYRRDRPDRERLRSVLEIPNTGPVFLVAIAIVEAETEALFDAIRHGLAGLGQFHLVVKTHPNRPAGDAAMLEALEALGADRCRTVPAGGRLHDYVAASDAMICIGSTVAFEAMALDVMPVVFENPTTFAATSLRDFQHALYVVRETDELRRALQEIRDDAPGALARRAAWPTTLRAVLGDLETPLPDQLQSALARLGIPCPIATPAVRVSDTTPCTEP
jgi:hypothetical protein